MQTIKGASAHLALAPTRKFLQSDAGSHPSHSILFPICKRVSLLWSSGNRRSKMQQGVAKTAAAAASTFENGSDVGKNASYLTDPAELIKSVETFIFDCDGTSPACVFCVSKLEKVAVLAGFQLYVILNICKTQSLSLSCHKIREQIKSDSPQSTY
ncbi:hypothetical protein O6H91_21G050600 [Diphasiastrum complanatum]|uniref:Uncharacterized protein n=1 Tax=Diphasiastrum complanatum TaxID=34168 RepID=A0ACC2AKE9_DIPCM|nr:hypothetical protein O6H91_21G050600 [Diphasiastrum complanatum]